MKALFPGNGVALGHYFEEREKNLGPISDGQERYFFLEREARLEYNG
jgi:hypothetical protein